MERSERYLINIVESSQEETMDSKNQNLPNVKDVIQKLFHEVCLTLNQSSEYLNKLGGTNYLPKKIGVIVDDSPNEQEHLISYCQIIGEYLKAYQKVQRGWYQRNYGGEEKFFEGKSDLSRIQEELRSIALLSSVQRISRGRNSSISFSNLNSNEDQINQRNNQRNNFSSEKKNVKILAIPKSSKTGKKRTISQSSSKNKQKSKGKKSKKNVKVSQEYYVTKTATTKGAKKTQNVKSRSVSRSKSKLI